MASSSEIHLQHCVVFAVGKIYALPLQNKSWICCLRFFSASYISLLMKWYELSLRRKRRGGKFSCIELEAETVLNYPLVKGVGALIQSYMCEIVKFLTLSVKVEITTFFLPWEHSNVHHINGSFANINTKIHLFPCALCS